MRCLCQIEKLVGHGRVIDIMNLEVSIVVEGSDISGGKTPLERTTTTTQSEGSED
jgi:hypothetical protein